MYIIYYYDVLGLLEHLPFCLVYDSTLIKRKKLCFVAFQWGIEESKDAGLSAREVIHFQLGLC